jgi:tetratricopeptide (TPR) repeat protein
MITGGPRDCKGNLQRNARRLFTLAGALLAAAVLGGTIGVVPAAADFASDNSLCHTFDSDKAAQKIAACTRVINTGRLSGRNLAIAYQDRAEGYRLSKEYDRALEDFNRAIKIDSGMAYPFLNRAEVWRLKGDYDQVIADATQAIRLDPALNASWTIRGMAYKEIGALNKAREDFNHALSIPVKGNDGNWAQDVARARLKELDK